MKKKQLIALGLAMVLAGAVPTSVFGATGSDRNNGKDVSVEATDADVNVTVASEESVPMYRLFNKGSLEHLYTDSTVERDYLSKHGWVYEGIGWYAPKEGREIYRLYNPVTTDHHYTDSTHERDTLKKKYGWKYEGIAWHTAEKETEGSVAIYRQFNPGLTTGAHNFTDSTVERDQLKKVGWVDEGIAWYGVKAPGKVTTDMSDASTVKEGTDLSYKGYTMKWEDKFDQKELDRDAWNVELHEPGWVNAELQEYVDSTDNIKVQDGQLILKPSKDKDGNITSGRVNTQNKHDFKYGLFEAKVKMPKGKGFLPAFWLMATDENLYGQWPLCGEIDAAEVMGQETDLAYGTIHYGNPHKQSQGTYRLPAGMDFSDSWHTFDVEWEPGKITWYVDGIKYHEESDWYSTKEGVETVSYPAPFDQNFYMILNLAVGGSWVGYPDDTVDINADSSEFKIDYVRVYQKDSYDENVKRPEKEVSYKEPDAEGNYVTNGNFSENEDLTDAEAWQFLTTQGGEGSAKIKDGQINIDVKNEGEVNYSTQLLQKGLPIMQGGTYKVTFDAWADAERTMVVDLEGPDNGWTRYLADTTVDLTTEKKSYEYTFKMEGKNDPNGSLEFNFGAQESLDGVHITNVKLVKVSQDEVADDNAKTVLADGNYVYNGQFQSGEGRMGYWEADKNNAAGTAVSVTNENNIRRLKIEAPEGTSEENPVIVSQDGLALTDGQEYAMSFDAEGPADGALAVKAAGQTYQAELNGKETSYNTTIVPAEGSAKDLYIVITKPGTYYLDNVRIVEDAMIKNGSFDAGTSGYEVYVDSAAKAKVGVDSLTEKNALAIDVEDTGADDWRVQVKQNNVKLEKGKWYTLTYKARASKERKIRVIMQGLEDRGWSVYSDDSKGTVDLTTEYQTFTQTFQMRAEDDPKAFLSICAGAVNGKQITENHSVYVDDISLVEAPAPAPGTAAPEVEAGVNQLKNADFANGTENWDGFGDLGSPAEGSVAAVDGAIVADIKNAGTEDFHVQLKQGGIVLEEGETYKLSFKASSTVDRQIKADFLDPANGYAWYGGGTFDLTSEEKEFEVTFKVDKETNPNMYMMLSMGKVGNNTPASTVKVSGLSLVKL